MHETLGDGYVIHSGGQRIYAEEDLPTRSATQVRHQEVNAFQEEICNVIRQKSALNATTEPIEQMVQLKDTINLLISEAVNSLAASDILNDSTVTGLTVKDALINLDNSNNINIGDLITLKAQMEYLHTLNSPVPYSLLNPQQPSLTLKHTYPARYLEGVQLIMTMNPSAPDIGQVHKSTTIQLQYGQMELKELNGSKVIGADLEVNNVFGEVINVAQNGFAVWAAGNGNGKVPTTISLPTLSTSLNWFHCFLLYNPLTNVFDYAIDSSHLAANIAAYSPIISAGFTYRRRIFSFTISADASKYWMDTIRQSGRDRFLFHNPGKIVLIGDCAISTATTQLDIPVPPNVLPGNVTAILSLKATINSNLDADTTIFLYSGDIALPPATAIQYDSWQIYQYVNDLQLQFSENLEVPVTNVGRAYINRSSGATAAHLTIAARGWVDPRVDL